MSYGKKVWIFPDAELPPKGASAIPGHESIIVANVAEVIAHIQFTLLYEDRAPVCFPVAVAPRRVRCLRTDRPSDFGAYIATEGVQYAIMLESDVPVVAQYGRADPRNVAFYTTPGYSE